MYSMCILSSILFNSIFFLALHFSNVVFPHICWWFTNASHVRCFVSVQNNTKCLPFDTIFTYSSICFAMPLYYFHICIRVMMINWAYIYNWKHTEGMTYMRKKTLKKTNKILISLEKMWANFIWVLTAWNGDSFIGLNLKTENPIDTF